jgi:hypothetical protein
VAGDSIGTVTRNSENNTTSTAESWISRLPH